MTHVATLIVDPAIPLLDDRHLRTAAEVLHAKRAPRWLARGVAAELPFAPRAGADNREYAARLRARLAPFPIDIVVQVEVGRRKRLLVADMDSTLIEQECIDELADVVGLREQVAALTTRSMNGAVAFEPALRERVALLRGLRLSKAVQALRGRITYTPGGEILVQTMRAHGARTAIVSGGFTSITAMVADALGFDAHHANRLEVDDDVLTGGLLEPILGREAKAMILRQMSEADGLRLEETLAVGDGANDIAMLAAAGVGVAFRAKPAVAAAARVRIDHGDLTALLYLQGYARTEFVSG